MSEPDNDSVSKFFQNAVRKPRIRFKEDDWKKMEAMLDASPPDVPGKKRRGGGVALPAALVLLAGLILFVSIKNEKLVTSEATSSKAEQNPKAQQNESALPKRNESDLLTQKGNDLPTRIESDWSVRGGNDLSKNTISNSSFIVRASSRKASLPLFDISQNDANEKSQSIIDEPGTRLTMGPKEEADSILGKSLIEDLVETDSVVPADSIPPDTKPGVRSKWSVMLALSPDFSSPGMHKFTTPGRAAAVVVYYHLNDALSVSAGVVASNRNYWDAGSNYKTIDENFWAKRTNGMVADKVLGSCSMLEIPLGLRYNLLHTERSTIYTSAQVSSYFMFNETYRYVFKSPNPGALDDWQARKPSHSMFSIANIAVGFERAVSRRMMIGLSPYINIPVTNMGGWSNVKLYSVGTAFTFRYKFQRVITH